VYSISFRHVTSVGYIFFSWTKSINKAIGRNIAVGGYMNHLYTNIAVIYRGFCENLYGPLAFLAVKNIYVLELPAVCECVGRRRERIERERDRETERQRDRQSERKNV
jgi:hypothetical protein